MSKKILLAIAVVLTALASKAQVIQKGETMLGGTFGAGSSNASNSIGNNSTSSTFGSIGPELGWGIGKNSELGFRGFISYGSSKDNLDNKTTSGNYQAGVFWKKFFPINDKVGWLSDLSAAYTYAKNTNNYQNASGNYSYNAKGYNVSLAPGVYYRATPKILLSAGIGGITYSYSKIDQQDPVNSQYPQSTSKSSGITVSLMSYYTFGISFLLGSRS
jgi:hypothetical protein